MGSFLLAHDTVFVAVSCQWIANPLVSQWSLDRPNGDAKARQLRTRQPIVLKSSCSVFELLFGWGFQGNGHECEQEYGKEETS